MNRFGELVMLRRWHQNRVDGTVKVPGRKKSGQKGVKKARLRVGVIDELTGRKWSLGRGRGKFGTEGGERRLCVCPVTPRSSLLLTTFHSVSTIDLGLFLLGSSRY